MSLIAILSARLPAGKVGQPDAAYSGSHAITGGAFAALLPFGGAPFIEHQARQMVDAGARVLLIHVDSDVVTPALAQVTERIGGWPGVTVALIRDMPDFAAHITPEDRVFILADAMLIPQSALAALAAGAAPRLLVAPHVAATQWLERIDAEDGWAGAALVEGVLVLDTIDMLGEWDLMSTLVRAAVQQGAGRLVISPEHAMHGELVRIEDDGGADRALEAIASAPDPTPGARTGPLARLVAPVGKALAGIIVRRQIAPGMLKAPAFAAGVLGLGLAAFGWPVTGIALALLACALRGTAREAGRILLYPPPPFREMATLDAMMLATLAAIALRVGAGAGFAIIAVLLAIGALVAVAPPEGSRWADEAGPEKWPALRPDIPTALVIMLAGVVAGLVPLALGLVGALSLGALTLRKSPREVAKP